MWIVASSFMALSCDGSNVPSAPGQRPPAANPQAPPPTPAGIVSVAYVLNAVNEKTLPVESPYGAGEWDYDADAGTWQLTGAFISLSDNGAYTNRVFHRAASGRTTTEDFVGTYTRTSSSTLLFHANGSSTTATISEDQLIWNWGNGMILTFEP